MSPLSDDKVEYSPVESSEDGLLDDEQIAPRIDFVWRRRFYILLSSSISLLLLILSFSAYKISSAKCTLTPGADTPYCKSAEETLMPAQFTNQKTAPAPLKFVNRYLTSDPDTPKFMGEPRPEMDQAWHELLEATMIRFSDEELILSNNATSVKHKDGGYVGGLGISHSLHCLVRTHLLPEMSTSCPQRIEEPMLCPARTGRVPLVKSRTFGVSPMLLRDLALKLYADL